MKYVKKFEKYLNEAETSSYAPPKYLVSPALAQDGSGKVDDPLTQYMEDELAKSKSYYKPGIRSANPPKNGNEVDRNLEEEMDESVNEAKEISKSKIDMMGSKILSRIKIGAKFITDSGDYTVTGFGPKSNAFQEYEAEKDGKPCKVKLTAMYGVKLEVTDDPRSAVYRKEEQLNSVILESLNENRFKKNSSMFGYEVNSKRPTLPKKVIPTLASIVKEFTDAYKSFDERDRNIWDLTDALWDELDKTKMTKVIMDWREENIATYLSDAFKNGLKAKSPSIESIESMLSQLPLDSGW